MTTITSAQQRTRRAMIATTTLAMLASLGIAPAAAQSGDYPSRPVKIVLPLPPGTVNDTALRLVAERLSKKWGQPVIVDNKPGASTIIGTDAVAKAQPDGYTLLSNVSLLAQNQSLRKKLPYDAVRDLAPITQFNRQQLALVVRGDFPARSIAELVTYAKTNPGKVNFGSWGQGSTAHLVAEKFRVDKGVQMTHIPFKGAAEITRAMLAGEVDIGVSDLLSPNEFIKAGKLRVIGVTGPSRLPNMPNVETLGEAGVKGFDNYSWFGIFAPAGTPPQIVRKIAEDIHQVQADPAITKRLVEDMFVTPSTISPDEFRKAFQQEITNWAAVVKATAVTLD